LHLTESITSVSGGTGLLGWLFTRHVGISAFTGSPTKLAVRPTAESASWAEDSLLPTTRGTATMQVSRTGAPALPLCQAAGLAR
jgi:hypothetical protein